MPRNFFEHDIRGPSATKSFNYRQDSVMGRNRKYRNNLAYSKSRVVDLDGDVDMNGTHAVAIERRFNPYSQKGQNNRRKHKKHSDKNKNERGTYNDADTHSWFKITIPHGKKAGKQFILKSITSLCKIPFTPFNFQFVGNAAEFYVSSYAISSRIRELNRRIHTPDGFKMLILSTKSAAAPATFIDPEVLEALKTCMSSHYDPMSHSLTLSRFHHNDALKLQGLYLPLSRSIVFTAVMKIIKENIPEIEVLNLTDNKLYSLDSMQILVPTCKRLKSLSLNNNRLRSISELNYLKGIELEDLNLDGNPLCDDFKEKTSYISAVRERFPKLLRLDAHELPPPIGFDLGPETFPASNKSFFAAPEVKDLVIQFLDLYYSIYDSGDRTRLLDAYHDQASFSICLSKCTPQKPSQNSLGAYAGDNRNLLRVVDSAERFKLLKQGKLGVVNALQDLPQTMHDPSSFSVDIFHVSPGLMSFSVIGVFKEVGAEINNATLKTFSRTFVVIPQGPGFVIINETLFIAHASTEQQSKAFKVPAPTPSPSPAPAEEKSPAEKQVLVLELSKQTGMNVKFSTQCLEDNGWDYQKSVAVFMKFQSEGKLPPEAFISCLN